MALLVAWQQRPSALAAAALGLCFGLATLVRPIAQFAAVPVLAAMALQYLRGAAWPRLLRHAACFLLAFSVVLAPWYARSYCYTGQFFLTKVSGIVMWASLFRGSTDNRLDPALPFADTPNTKALLARLEGVNVRGHWNVLLRAGGAELYPHAGQRRDAVGMSGCHSSPPLEIPRYPPAASRLVLDYAQRHLSAANVRLPHVSR